MSYTRKAAGFSFMGADKTSRLFDVIPEEDEIAAVIRPQLGGVNSFNGTATMKAQAFIELCHSEPIRAWFQFA